MTIIVINNSGELWHHGVKGQHWGVRRYTNKDGSPTTEGVIRTRTTNAAKTKSDVDSIIETMSKKDKKLLNLDSDNYLSLAEGQFVVKRILLKHKNTPISFFDLLRDGDNLEVAIGSRSGEEYRNKGYATAVAKKGMKWCEENRDRWDTIRWGAKKENTASNKLAKKMNFKLAKSDDTWNNYVYK